MICISIGNMEQLERVNQLKPGLVEARYDLLGTDPDLFHESLARGISQLATCRPGTYSDQERLAILKKAVDRGARYVDVEIESELSFIQELAVYMENRESTLIVSYHNYNEVPANLEEILADCYGKGGQVAKIACMVNNEKDNARLLSLYKKEGRKVVLGMGEKGRISRLASLYLGAEFTFASLDKEGETAPGQLSYAELLQLKEILN